jgi:hypothetical protein
MIYVLDPFFYFIFFSLLFALLQAVYHSGQRLGRLYVLEMNSHGSITFRSLVRSEPVGESVDFMFFSRLLSRHVHRSIPLQLEMDKYVNVTCPSVRLVRHRLSREKRSKCAIWNPCKSPAVDVLIRPAFFFFRKKPNVSKPSWQPPTKAAYVELHCIRHVERSFQLSCYTLENIYKYLAPRSRRSRRSREIHSAQKSDGGGLRGLGTNLMAFARTSGCAPAPEGERYAVCRLAGWLAFNSHPRAASFSL